MNYTNEEIQVVVNKYLNGFPATTISKEENISRSTLYNCIFKFKEVPISKANISNSQIHKDKIKLERLERENSIFFIFHKKSHYSQKLKQLNNALVSVVTRVLLVELRVPERYPRPHKKIYR